MSETIYKHKNVWRRTRCSSCRQQAPPRLRDYYAYGVDLCHSTYRKL